MRLVFLLGAVALSLPAQTASDPLHSTYDALFASFIPLEQIEQTPQAGKLFLAARDGIWSAASGAPAFKQLITPFINLQGFGTACHMADYLQETGTNAFSSLGPAQRQHVLFLLQTCSENDARRLAMNVRNFYVVKTYEAVQEPLTGVKLNLYAPATYAAEHLPKLAPTRLAYDFQHKQLVSKDREFDYLIVGSGPAGSVLGHELRRGGKHVLVVERGAFVVPGSMETRLIDDLIDTRTSADGAIRIRNGMTVGGGSQVNVDLCFAPTLPSIQFKIQSWRAEGRIGPQDFTIDQITAAYSWVRQAIGTRVLSESEINPNNRVLWDGAKLAGLHPKLYDLNTYAPGRSPYPVTDKRSAESELLLSALADSTNPLSLLPDADVRRVLFEGKKAVGVEVRMRAAITNPGVIADPNKLGIPSGETFTIRARNIVLSAGALGSATILLRSDVHNNQIGRGVVLHPSIPIMGLFDRNIDVLSGTEASVFVDDKLISEGYALESMADQPLYAALMSPGSALQAFDMVKQYRRLAGFGVMLIDTPSPDNRLTLDANGEPVITYTLSEPDKVRFRRGVAEAVRIMFLAGAKQVMLPTTENLLSDTPETELQPLVLTDAKQSDAVETRLRFIPNRTIVTSAHMQGTNKMGSVVSPDFKVIGTESLYVVDGSIFPTSIGANPMQSIYAFAKIFADGH